MTGSIDSVFGHALTGMNRAFDQADGAARRIAGGNVEAEPVIDLLSAKTAVQANAAVVRTADRMQDRLLDILA
ncbi:MAG: flagellar hook protein FlgE [Rhodospirillaceae bacterium]|nr:flagellar hook protein FlgE [Rhodospirillaceae bacterium]